MAFPENTVNDTGIKHIWDKVTTALSGKVDKVSGKGLSTNDYTTAEKEKLSGIEAGAQVNAVTSVAGKTGAVTLDKADVGLGNVDNTSDASKPISTATQNALDTKADTSEVAGTQTVSGNPITLTDASETYAQGLTVELEPKQDLHEQSAPYVGGAGKNLLPMTVAGIKELNTSGTWSGNAYTLDGVTFTILTDNGNNVIGIKVNGTASADVSFTVGTAVSSGATYTFNGCPSGGSENTYYARVTYMGNDIGQGNYNKTIDQGNSLIYIIEIKASAIVTNQIFYPMIILSTSTTDFAPYSNICPISGYEGVEVEDVWFNQWDEEWLSGYYNDNGVYVQTQTTSQLLCSQNMIAVTPNTSYFMHYRSGNYRICYYDINYNFIERTDLLIAESIFTTPSDAYYINFHIDYILDYKHDICINISKPTGTPKNGDYLPYQSRTASVTFGQTVYGGKSNFTEGGTEKTKVEYTFTGNETYESGSYGRVFVSSSVFNAFKNPAERGIPANMICEGFKVVRDDAVEGGSGQISFWASRFGFCLTRTTTESGDVNALKAVLVGMKVVIELATPTTISTPPNDLKLLQDTNNLTTNGTTITLDYIPNNSIGDAVKASEEYTDRAIERVAVAPKATLIDTWMISEEADTISVDLTSYDCNFFLLEYLFQSKRGTTLIPRPQGGSFSASVVTYNNGTPYYIELDYNPTTKELAYTSNVTSQFGILAIYTI